MRSMPGFVTKLQLLTGVWFIAVTLAGTSDAEVSTAPAGSRSNASTSATQTFTMNLGGEPATLNPLTGADYYFMTLQPYLFDSLMERDPETNEWRPALAEKVEKSPDGRAFTFKLREGAAFHDGRAVTAEDVKFSFDFIFDPNFDSAQLRPLFEGIEKAEVIDARTVRFSTKSTYFGNFDAVAGLFVLPKYIYSYEKTNGKPVKALVGSGPYKLERYDRGQSLLLAKNRDWWGFKLESKKGVHNFERIRMRFISEETTAIEALKKGELDYIPLTAEAFFKHTIGPEWDKTVIKQKIENSSPKRYNFIGWNWRRDLFKNRDVRRALYHLVNRDELNRKFRFGSSLPAIGPWYQQSEYADPSVKAVDFNPKKALELLKEAGWVDSDKNGVLDQTVDGGKKEFRFTLNYSSKDQEKYWVLYQSDLKKVGIEMNLRYIDWNVFIKAVDEGNFDAVALSWGGGPVDLDPKVFWHTDAIKGGSNILGYSNPEVDQLIDQARKELDKKKRNPLLRKVFAKIAEDAPMAFLFIDPYAYYAHSARVRMTKPTYRYTIGTEYWWKDRER